MVISPPAALHLVHQVGKVFFGGGDAPGSLQVLCSGMGASSWLYAEVVPGLCPPAGTHAPFFGRSRRAARILHRRAAAECLQEGSAAAAITAAAVVLITGAELRRAERANEGSKAAGRKAAATFLTQLPPGGAGGTKTGQPMSWLSLVLEHCIAARVSPGPQPPIRMLLVPFPFAQRFTKDCFAKTLNFSEQGAKGGTHGCCIPQGSWHQPQPGPSALNRTRGGRS